MLQSYIYILLKQSGIHYGHSQACTRDISDDLASRQSEQYLLILSCLTLRLCYVQGKDAIELHLASAAKQVVWAGGGQNNEVHVCCGNACHVQSPLCCCGSMLTQRLTLCQHMPPPEQHACTVRTGRHWFLACGANGLSVSKPIPELMTPNLLWGQPDASPGCNPVIIGVHQLLQVCIAEHCLWDTAPRSSQSTPCRNAHKSLQAKQHNWILHHTRWTHDATEQCRSCSCGRQHPQKQTLHGLRCMCSHSVAAMCSSPPISYTSKWIGSWAKMTVSWEAA